MSTTQTALIVIGIVVVLLLAVGAWVMMRRQALRRRFGPEYDRVLQEQDSRGAAEHELRERERAHASLQLRELSPQAREEYSRQWQTLQARFIDEPEAAVGDADELVTHLISERGYPTGDYDEQLAHLSVEHARTLGDYREAHDISVRNRDGRASTEELRRAVVHFRALAAELLGESPVTTPTASDANHR